MGMRKKLLIAAALVFALLVLPVAGTLSGLWWMLVHPEGTAWLLQHAPSVKVSGAKGALLGDFEADRVEFDARPEGLHLVLGGFGWRGLHFSSAGGWRQWKLSFDELRAARVDLNLAPSKTALKAPSDLVLPLEVEVKSLRVGALYVNTLGEKPLRDVAAQLHLGAEAGELHRVDALTLAWDRLRASGSARIGTHAPLQLQAALDLANDLADDVAKDSAAALPAWNLKASLAGPLEAPAMTATLRAQPAATATASAKAAPVPQSLDAQATLRPFAPWPLGDLKLTAKALDLAAFHSAAPTTALDLDALAKTQGLDQPVVVTLALANAAAGRWNEGRLPLRRITLDLRGRPDDTHTLDLHTLDAELGDMKQSAGRLQGSGRWTPDRWTFDSTLTALQPALLDSRAPLMQFSGPVTLAGSGFSGATLDAATLDLKAALAGRLADNGPARAVQLGVDATLGARAIELRSAEASAGGARATLKGSATRSANDAPWRVVGKTSLVEFDPAPWWPGTDHPAWRKGPHQLNASGDFDLTLPRGADAKPLAERLALLRGQADLKIARSLLAGVPLEGDVTLRSSSSNSDSGPVTAALNLDVAGNTVHADGRLSPTGTGADDAWDLKIAAASLERLAPLWRLMQPGAAAGAKLEGAPTGSLNATAQLKGRWPAITTQGQLDANTLRLAGVAVQRAEARWQMGTALTDATDTPA
jgi:translocation and assembly module TamB